MIWLIALAGGLGAVCRFALDGQLQRIVTIGFASGTFAINVSGSFLLGFLHGWLPPDAWALAILGTGFCGGFTTFSTASVEAVRVFYNVGARRAIGYAGATLAGCVALAWLGVVLGSLL